MNCYLHADVAAAAFCRSCGKPLCAECQRTANGTIYCPEHVPLPSADAQNPYVQPPAPFPAPSVSTSPGLAFLLGVIPGVGAIYNGQYLKGLVHAVIFGLLISLANSMNHDAGVPLIIMCIMAFAFYMPFEAYHTSKKRLLGQPVEEFSSLIAQSRFSSRTPIGPILLIVIGVLFLLDTMDVIQFRVIARFWPILLIVAGAAMLYNRVSAVPHTAVEPIAREYGERRQ